MDGHPPPAYPTPKIVVWSLLLIGLGLACVGIPGLVGRPAETQPPSIPPEALTVTALAQQIAQQQTQVSVGAPSTATPLVLPTTTMSGSLPTPPPWPTILPTQVPAWSQATPTPRVVTGPAPVLPATGIAAELWDYPSEKDVKGPIGPYAPKGGDVYDTNLYERPFREQSQDTFFPDLDIQYVRLARQGDWYFAQIRLAGLNPGANAPTGQYGLEIDVDVDGRGDFLVWVHGPLSTQWQPQGAAVYQDVRKDVEGPRVCTSDAPLRGDGYDNKVYEASPQPALIWVRWGTETVAGKLRPTVYIIFHHTLIPDDDGKFLWQAWADGKVQQPGQMTYHDAYTLQQAGVPYPGNPNYPIKDLARMDSTCRATFGFRATGAEPCLCRNEQTVPVCPQPEEPPLTTCTFGPGPYWTCTDPQQANRTLYCIWDAELCQWDCREEQLCPAPEPGSLPEWMRVLPGASVSSMPAIIGGTTGGQPYSLDLNSFYVIQAGESGPFTPLQQQCGWDERLCRFVCREEEKVCTSIPEAPRPGCDYLGEETWKCAEEIGFTIYRWNKDLCRWDYIPSSGQCIAPETPPMAGCTEKAPNTWECIQAGEISFQYTCTWDANLCDWNCTPACQADDSCYQDAQGIWVCPGKGKFQQCRWDENECRWRCWDPIRPKPDDGGDTECQPKNFCSFDPPLWYCNDGNSYETCTYDGCQWTCE